MIILTEIQPLDTVAGTRKTVRATNANIPSVTALNDVIWRPAVSEVSTLSIRLFKGDFDGTYAPGGGNLGLQVDQLIATDANIRRFVWTGAPVKIWAGVAGQSWPWDLVFDGMVGEGPSAEANKVTLPLKVNTEPFDADVLTLKYAGSGGAEGGADLRDKPKPWLLGRCFNAEPVMIDSVNNVLQFSAYGAIQGVAALYERGSQFGASIGDYATYALLVAATIPAGRWGTCLATGMIRLGAPPYGVITGDVDGDAPSGVWRRKTGEIITRVATHLGVSALTDTASLTALDTALAGLGNQGRIGIYLTDQETLLSLTARLAAPCNAQAGISLLGKLFVSRVGIGTPTVTLDAQQRQMPRVTSSVESGVSPPFSLVQFGYARSWRVHTIDEIATGITLTPRGLYSATATYREGDIVETAAGALYYYTNATPSAGTAPPTGTHWTILQQAPVVIDAPVERVIQCDHTGTPISGQLPDTFSIRVSRGGTSIKLADSTTYRIDSESNVTSTINNTNGSASKGDVTVATVSSNDSGVTKIVVAVDGADILPVINVRYRKVLGTAPVTSGAGGAGLKTASVSPNATISGTSYAVISPVATMTVASGESLYVTAPLDYSISGLTADTRTATVKCEYRPLPSGSWTDFVTGTGVTGSAASSAESSGPPDYDVFDAVNGFVAAGQTKSGLSAGDYEVRLSALLNATGRTASFIGNILIEAKV